MAETVFISQLLREYRQRQVDINFTARQVLKEHNPTFPIEFMGRLVQEHVKLIRLLAPSVTEGKAIQQLQQVRHQLARAQRQLHATGLPVPHVEADPGLLPHQHDPEEAGVSPRAPSPAKKKRRTDAACLSQTISKAFLATTDLHNVHP